jgi:hypothetical protein
MVVRHDRKLVYSVRETVGMDGPSTVAPQASKNLFLPYAMLRGYVGGNHEMTPGRVEGQCAEEHGETLGDAEVGGGVCERARGVGKIAEREEQVEQRGVGGLGMGGQILHRPVRGVGELLFLANTFSLSNDTRLGRRVTYACVDNPL